MSHEPIKAVAFSLSPTRQDTLLYMRRQEDLDEHECHKIAFAALDVIEERGRYRRQLLEKQSESVSGKKENLSRRKKSRAEREETE